MLRELPLILQDMVNVDDILGVSTSALLFEVQRYEWTETLLKSHYLETAYSLGRVLMGLSL